MPGRSRYASVRQLQLQRQPARRPHCHPADPAAPRLFSQCRLNCVPAALTAVSVALSAADDSHPAARVGLDGAWLHLPLLLPSSSTAPVELQLKMPLLSYLQHRRACKSKQSSRSNAISSLPPAYHEPLSKSDVGILATPVAVAAAFVRKGEWKPIDVLRAYGKRALVAHEKTNCLTEILIPSAEEWLAHSSSMGAGGVGDGVNLNGPLAGIPVSVKDTVNVRGYDSCIGFSKWINTPATHDAAIVRLLRDAGAVPFVKTNIPITLLSFESTNDVFGRTDNPHVEGYSPGGSTGGEAALIALGGSRIGIGTDVAGSVRVPAHYSGIYTLRCSTGRFPRAGNNTSMAGQEGVLAVYSPMTKTMDDLSYFMKTIIDMKPWEYDHSVLPIPWRDVKPELEGKKIRWGVMRDDGVVTPSPACARALETVVNVLKSHGEEVVELEDFPSPYKALQIASHLLNSDGGRTFSSHFRSFFESNDAGVAYMTFYFALPRWIKFLHSAWVRHVRRDAKWAGLLEGWSARSAHSQWKLVAAREDHKAEWFAYMQSRNIDFLLSVPNALPACPAGGMKNGFSSCGYTFMWNLIDYACGVLPVTTVSAAADALPDGFVARLDNAVARSAFADYDAAKMQGLPVGVQVVARRLEEEKCLWGMQRVVECLEGAGQGWKGIEI